MVTCIYINVRTPYQTTVVIDGLSLKRPRFSSKQIQMWLVVEKVALGHVLLPNI